MDLLSTVPIFIIRLKILSVNSVCDVAVLFPVCGPELIEEVKLLFEGVWDVNDRILMISNRVWILFLTSVFFLIIIHKILNRGRGWLNYHDAASGY